MFLTNQIWPCPFLLTIYAQGCEECEAGKYQKNKGANTCVRCEAGTYSAEPKLAVCINCLSGVRPCLLAPDENNFSNVNASTRLLSHASHCKYATVFFQEYQPLSGETSCRSCAPGKFSVSPREWMQTCTDSADYKLILCFSLHREFICLYSGRMVHRAALHAQLDLLLPPKVRPRAPVAVPELPRCTTVVTYASPSFQYSARNLLYIVNIYRSCHYCWHKICITSPDPHIIQSNATTRTNASSNHSTVPWHNETSFHDRGESAEVEWTRSASMNAHSGIAEVDGASSTGATRCVPCAAGKFTNFAGAASCQECKPNFISEHSASTTCLQCPRGTYQVGTWSQVGCWMLF
jgi:hypothetical protein